MTLTACAADKTLSEAARDKLGRAEAEYKNEVLAAQVDQERHQARINAQAAKYNALVKENCRGVVDVNKPGDLALCRADLDTGRVWKDQSKTPVKK
jgi:hypothetical protein